MYQQNVQTQQAGPQGNMSHSDIALVHVDSEYSKKIIFEFKQQIDVESIHLYTFSVLSLICGGIRIKISNGKSTTAQSNIFAR